MANYPPPPPPSPGYDPRDQRRFQRDQFRAQMRAQRDAIRAQRDQIRFQMLGLRRGSVLGPILLIAIGILFLMMETGRLDRQLFWDWYGHWWPLLLVVAGVVLLAEWMFDQFHMRDPQRAPYRRTLGAGVFLLLVILGTAGYVDNNVHGFPSGRSRLFPGWHVDPDSFDEIFGDKHESDQTLDLAIPSGSSVSVVDPRGDVTIDGTSDDGRVHIAEHKQVYAYSDTDANRKAQQLSPTVAGEGAAISINMAAIEGARSDVVITVPAAAAISINANRGDIHVASIKAAVTAIANHGDIDLSAITGAATAHINSGSSSLTAHSMGSGVAIEGHAQDVTLTDIAGPVTLSGEFFGTHLEHIRGAIHYHTSRTDFQVARLDGEADISPRSDFTAEQAVGPLVLTTSNHNINLERIAGDIAVTDHNGTIELTAAPPIGTITLEDRTGSVRVTLPEKANFAIQADATNGNIDTNLNLPTQAGPQNDGRRTTLTGSSNGGGPEVRITTSNGDISIDKGPVLPLPPLPPTPPKVTLAPAAPSHAPRAPKSPDEP
jgi:DUF4097 and DUF4098 domain-containing protein YvlB